MNTNCEAFIFFKLHKVADHEHDDDCDEFVDRGLFDDPPVNI